MQPLWIILAFVSFPVLAGDDPRSHPGQPQFRPDREVKGPLPRDRCLRAVYGQELEAERGGWAEQWHPPIDDDTARWLFWHRERGNLVVETCDLDINA